MGKRHVHTPVDGFGHQRERPAKAHRGLCTTNAKHRAAGQRSASSAPPWAELSRRLLKWYDQHQRSLPWRGTSDPYAIWVSEIMLQQTQVATVIDYYLAWLKRFPTVHALAAASEDEVLHAWQGLGYYSRARRLRQGAQYLVSEHAGGLPRSPEAWLKVPGVGRYTAGAITSIAFGSMAPVLDGNVVRVLCRLLALGGSPARAPLAQMLWQHAEALLVPERPGDINQALMELGATVCTPRSPSCAVCPWVKQCRAFAEGSVQRYPELPARPKPTEVTMAAAILQHGRRVLLAQQPANAKRWASMWLFPCMEVSSERAAPKSLARHLQGQAGLPVNVGERLGTFKHSVTRFRITLHTHQASLQSPTRRTPRGFAWVKPEELDEYALPAVHRRIARHLTSL